MSFSDKVKPASNAGKSQSLNIFNIYLTSPSAPKSADKYVLSCSLQRSPIIQVSQTPLIDKQGTYLWWESSLTIMNSNTCLSLSLSICHLSLSL